MALKESDLIIGIVKKIEKTTVFIEIEGNVEGTLVFSEIAAGRIRNLRDYIAINKRIVCKVLKIENNHIELSLRRVTVKEREEVLEKNKKQKNIISMLRAITKNPDSIIIKIKEKSDLLDFFEEAKENPAILQKFFTKQEAEKLSLILKEKAEKEKIVKKTFKLFSTSSTGIEDIKEILNIPEVEIRYLGSSTFSINKKATNFKSANKKLLSILQQIEQKAKNKQAHFEIKEK